MWFNRSSTVTVLVPSMDPLYELQESKFKRELKIERRARQEAVLKRPETDASDLDELQQKIVDRCHDALHTMQQWVGKEFRKCADVLPHTEAIQSDFSVDEIKTGAKLDITKLKAEAKDDLIALRIAERRLLRERSFFQQENRLTRSAHYPSSQLFAISLLTVMVLGEAIANAYLFARGNVFGLLGGWLQALIVSLANVVVSFVLGMFVLRNLHHVNWLRKGIALFLLPIGLFVLAAFNLAVAHYRDLLETDPDNALVRALGATRAAPFQLDNLESVILLLVGIVICVFAAWDGYSVIDDPYPEYGKIDRRYQDSVRKYEARKQCFRADLSAVMDSALTRVADRIGSIERRYALCNSLVNQCALVVKKYNHAADQTAKLAHRLLKVYREANCKVRTTDPPRYFDSYPDFPLQAIETPRELRERRDWLGQGLDSARESANTVRQEMHSVIQYEVEQLFEFVDEIEQQADRKIDKEAKLLMRQASAAK